jgi:RNA polymerase sigma factor (sigma-70 family)
LSSAEAASAELIEEHLWLVHVIARRFRRRPGVELEDLIQEGCLGLLRARVTFQPERATRFSTYAGYWVEAYIRRHALNRREWAPSSAPARRSA